MILFLKKNLHKKYSSEKSFYNIFWKINVYNIIMLYVFYGEVFCLEIKQKIKFVNKSRK